MKIICANWKFSEKLRKEKEAVNYLQKLEKSIAKKEGIEVKVFANFLVLKKLAKIAKKVKIGAQDLHWEEDGSFTGAPPSAKDLLLWGVKEVLIGHSETRFYFGVNDERVVLKLESAFKNGIFPTICLGETLEEKEKNQTEKVLKRQIEKGILPALTKIKPPQNSFLIAYEPVYAISGFAKILGKEPKPAKLEDIEVAHRTIKKILENSGYPTKVLYGGSCNKENAKELLSQEFIDGLLVGSASFEFNSFFDIIKNT